MLIVCVCVCVCVRDPSTPGNKMHDPLPFELIYVVTRVCTYEH